MWPDSPGEVIFGDVKVSAGVAQSGIGKLIFPFASIVPREGTVDPDDPQLWNVVFEVVVIARVAGDSFGETVLIGGPRTSQGSSGGRGLTEIEEEVKKTLRFLNATSGVRIRLLGSGAVVAVENAELGYVASRAYQFAARTTDERSYAAATRFTAVDATGGDVDLAWTLPPDRFDRNALVLRRAAGATPPASVSAGTGITVGALVTSLTDDPGVGEFSYSLFMGYDETNETPATSDRFSAAATATETVT